MKDLGLIKGLVQSFDTSAQKNGSLFGLRKMFRDYLNKLNVPFYDPCCPDYSTANALLDRTTASAINATATATAAQVAGGVITSTSAAATTITLPTATLLATYLDASQGSSQELIVDNSAGASVVTVAVGAGIVATSVLTGGTTMTVAAGSVGVFKIVFTSATAGIIGRIV